MNGAGEGNLRLNSTQSDVPVLEKVSDKGIYLVQLKWNELPLNPQNAFALEVVFLNASAPVAYIPVLPETAETNASGSGSEASFTVPEVMDSPLPVDSYDIVIYSDSGEVLWEKVNQPGQGGRGGQRIMLENNYTGPVTIEINNIKPGWDTAGSAASTTATTNTTTSASGGGQ